MNLKQQLLIIVAVRCMSFYDHSLIKTDLLNKEKRDMTEAFLYGYTFEIKSKKSKVQKKSNRKIGALTCSMGNYYTYWAPLY